MDKNPAEVFPSGQADEDNEPRQCVNFKAPNSGFSHIPRLAAEAYWYSPKP